MKGKEVIQWPKNNQRRKKRAGIGEQQSVVVTREDGEQVVNKYNGLE